MPFSWQKRCRLCRNRIAYNNCMTARRKLRFCACKASCHIVEVMRGHRADFLKSIKADEQTYQLAVVQVKTFLDE